MDTNISDTTCTLTVEVMDKLQAMTNQELAKYLEVHVSADSPELIRELSIRYFGLLTKWNEHHDPTK